MISTITIVITVALLSLLLSFIGIHNNLSGVQKLGQCYSGMAHEIQMHLLKLQNRN